MALTADEVVVTFRAEMDRYKSELRSSTALFEQATNRQAKQIQHLESQIKASSGQIGSTLKGLAAGFATAFSVQQLVQFADGFTRIQNALKITGLEGAALTGVQDKLFASAQKFGAEYEAIAGVYSKGAQAANELGASQEQLLQFTDAVGAALKVQGGSAAASQGALLQLGQALGAGVVRAEEFNSIIEGAYPLAQAAARGIDGYGGSVAKLRAAIADGKVTSEQFFQGILVGSTTTIAQAEGATLTLAGAMTTLQNAMVQYVGGASSASGASAAFANGIALLAQNIDTVANALAVIAVVVGSRYVAAMVSATSASVAKTIADIRAKAAADSLAASQARATGILGANSAALGVNAAASGRAAVAMGLVTTAGRGLMAVLGGPVGVALAAVTIGLGYMAAESANAEAELMALEQRTADTTAKTKALEDRMREAGIQVKSTGDAFSATKGAAWDLGGQLAQLVNHFTNVALSARDAELAVARFAMQSSAKAYMDSRRSDAASASSFGGFGRDPMDRRVGVNTGSGGNQRLVKESPATKALRAQFEADRDYYRLVEQTPTGAKGDALFATGGGGGASVAPKSAKARKGARERVAKGKTGPSRAELDARAASEQRQLDMEILALKKDEKADVLKRVVYGKEATVTDEDRARIANEMLALEREERQAQLDANKDLTPEQRAKQQAALNQIYGATPIPGENIPTGGLKGAAIEAENDKRNAATILERRNRVIADSLAMAQAQNDAVQAELATMLDSASTRKERYDIESEMLMLDYDAQRAAIENSDLDEKIKEQKRRQLHAETELAKQQLNRAYESPLESYANDITQVGNNLNDTFEGIAVDGLQSLNDGIVDAIMGAKSLGDVFKNVANQIIADLIRIAVQQMIIKPLMEAMGSASGSGGSGGSGDYSSLFSGIVSGISGKRAMGGPVAGGRTYLVGEKGPELFTAPATGKIIPNHAINNPGLMRGSMGGGNIVNQTFVLDARGGITTPDLLQYVNNVAADKAQQAGGAAYKQSMADAPKAVARRNRFGA